MKKYLFILLLIWQYSFAQNIKTNNFVGIDYGQIAIVDKNDPTSVASIKYGSYFYDPNPYLISNRFYGSLSKVFTSNVDFYIAKINLDWIFNNYNYIKPFIGVDLGYAYYNDDNNNDYSTALYGVKFGILANVSDSIDLELQLNIDQPSDNTAYWTNSFKQAYAGINFSF